MIVCPKTIEIIHNNTDSGSVSRRAASWSKSRRTCQTWIVDKSGFHIDFKTTHPDGLIFFMMNEEGKKDFVALFINNHKLVYSFNCGSGPSYLETSLFMVTDGKFNKHEYRIDEYNYFVMSLEMQHWISGNWYSVEFSRLGKNGKLLFDSIEVKVPDPAQYSGGITAKPHIYLGGLDDTMRQDDNIKRELASSMSSLRMTGPRCGLSAPSGPRTVWWCRAQKR